MNTSFFESKQLLLTNNYGLSFVILEKKTGKFEKAPFADSLGECFFKTLNQLPLNTVNVER